MENEDGSLDSLDSAYSNYPEAESRVQEIMSHTVSLYPSIKEVLFNGEA